MRNTSAITCNFLARLTEHFQTHATANVRQLPRQVNERAFGPDVFGGAFSDDVCTARFIPLSFHLETGEVTWSRAIVCFDSGHARASFTENRMYVSYRPILPRLSIFPTLRNLQAS